MYLALGPKNKLGFVNGTILEPVGVDSPSHAIWYRCNRMIISLILNSVFKEIAESVIYMRNLARTSRFIHSKQWS